MTRPLADCRAEITDKLNGGTGRVPDWPVAADGAPGAVESAGMPTRNESPEYLGRQLDQCGHDFRGCQF